MESKFVFLEKSNNPQLGYYFQQGFNQMELDRIEREVSYLPFQNATTFGEGDSSSTTNKEVRSSKIKWIPQDHNWKWLYEKLGGMVNIANNELWQFNITTMGELIQYTEYHASDSGHYDWHQDIGPGEGSRRKISITVQLSEADEYEGGDLEMWSGGKSVTTAHRGAGSVFIFPSYMMHRVTPITKGIRKSFVLWVGGSPYN